MLAADRQAKIIELLQQRGSVQVEELAQELKVSAMTIRRDLVKLQKNNQIERCHGGALLKQEVAYEEKQTSHKSEKEKLAEACLQFVSEGDTVFLDAGTTTYEIAGLLKDIPGIRIVTNDLEIAQIAKNSSAEVIVCGGVMQKSTGSMWGYYATEMMRNFRFDVGFFGGASINEEFYVMTPTIDKAFLKREIVEQCDRSYLVVDESKFGRQAMTRINHLGDYTAVITDKEFNDAQKKELAALGVTIIRDF